MEVTVPDVRICLACASEDNLDIKCLTCGSEDFRIHRDENGVFISLTCDGCGATCRAPETSAKGDVRQESLPARANAPPPSPEAVADVIAKAYEKTHGKLPPGYISPWKDEVAGIVEALGKLT